MLQEEPTISCDGNNNHTMFSRILLKHHVNIWRRAQLTFNTEAGHTRGIKDVKTFRSDSTSPSLKQNSRKSLRHACVTPASRLRHACVTSASRLRHVCVTPASHRLLLSMCDSTEMGKKCDVSLCSYFHHRKVWWRCFLPFPVSLTCLWCWTWFLF